MAEKYLVLSIGDEKSKHIAEILGNKTAKKIIEILSEKELSVTDLSKKLNLPINTIDYNVKKLLKAGLIEKTKNYFWSVKGKKIPTYKVSNKKILISPKKSFLEKTKLLILPAIITFITALIIRYQTLPKPRILQSKDMAIQETVTKAVEAPPVSAYILQFPAWMWFLAGAWLAIIIFFIITLKKEVK